VIGLVLLGFAVAGIWTLGALNYDARLSSARAQLASERLSAWRFGTDIQTLGNSLRDPEVVPAVESALERAVWIKVFQVSDVRPREESLKYHNAAYEVSSSITLEDVPSSAFVDFVLRGRTAPGEAAAALRDVFHFLSMKCRVD
jgi:hypothetical protein